MARARARRINARARERLRKAKAGAHSTVSQAELQRRGDTGSGEVRGDKCWGFCRQKGMTFECNASVQEEILDEPGNQKTVSVLPRFLRLASGCATPSILICRFLIVSVVQDAPTHFLHPFHDCCEVPWWFRRHGPPETSLQRVKRWIELGGSSTPWALPAPVLPVRASRIARSAPRAVGCF